MRREASMEDWNRLYELAVQFKKRKPWEEIYNDEIIAVSFSGEETAYFTIMGNGGMRYGFSMYTGRDGLNSLVGLMDGEVAGQFPQYLIAEQNNISMFLSGRDEVPKEQTDTIHELGLKFRGKNAWIYFERYEKGYIPYQLNQEEVQFCTKYMEKFLEALECYRQEPCRAYYMEGSLYVYREDGGQWKGHFEETPLKHYEFTRSRFTDEIMMKKLRKAKKTRKAWEMDCYSEFRGMTDPKYEKPAMERYFLLMDHDLDMVVKAELLLPEEWGRAVSGLLAQAILELGCPKKIIVPNQFVSVMIEELCSICKIKLETGDALCCENYKRAFQGNMGMEIMEGLEQMGIDFGKLQKMIDSGMSEDEFVESAMVDFNNLLMDLFEDDGAVDHNLRTRKQKIGAVMDFYGQGSLPEEYYDETEKWIEGDLADEWKVLLGESTKQQLFEMAAQMGVSVNKSASKGVLLGAVMSKAAGDASALAKLLTEEERDTLELLAQGAEDMEACWEKCDFSLTMEQVLKLLNYGFIDIGLFTSDVDITLVLKPAGDLMDILDGNWRRGIGDSM